MSNINNKQPPDLTKSLTISDNAQAPSTTTQTVKKPDYVGINLVEMSSVKPPEKNDSLGISGINQPDVTTGNLSHSDEASTGIDVTIAILPQSICKVPRILRDLSVKSFIPQLVSIGPIHKENDRLKEFEWLKKCYLDDLLHRCFSDSKPKETILEACLQKVTTKIPQIRKSYTGVKKKYEDDELASMMVMDGCFILEFCFKHEQGDNLYLPNKMQKNRIAMDLMLLENQVPFFVLQALFDCSIGKVPFSLSNVLDAYLAPYIYLFHHDLLPVKKSIFSNVLDKYLAPCIKLFRSQLPEKISNTDVHSDLPEKNSTTDAHSQSTHAHSESTHAHSESTHAPSESTHVHSDSTQEHDHVLSYLHKRYHYGYLAKASKRHRERTAFHSAVELDRSGINFKPHQEGDWSMTIKFQSHLFACFPWLWSKPTLLMPPLVIDDFTELILRNFIAYEQSFDQDRDCFTSYAYAMDMLIKTQEDIAKLADSKVLFNKLGSNKKAAVMINKIGRNMFVKDFYYTKEFKRMDKYYNAFCPMIKRTYFSNPWNAINLLVGMIAFLATVVSAYVAVLEYFF